MLVGVGGVFGNVVRIQPPLVITRPTRPGVEVLEQALAHVTTGDRVSLQPATTTPRQIDFSISNKHQHPGDSMQAASYVGECSAARIADTVVPGLKSEQQRVGCGSQRTSKSREWAQARAWNATWAATTDARLGAIDAVVHPLPNALHVEWSIPPPTRVSTCFSRTHRPQRRSLEG